MSAIVNADKLLETAARYIGENAVLYVDHHGTWSVGQRGQSVEQYSTVKVDKQLQINDDSYEVTALAVEKNGTGYNLFVQSNNDANTFWVAALDSNGGVTGVQALDNASLFAAEKRLGDDLNGNGGIGDAAVLWAEGDANLYADGSGKLFLQAGSRQLALLNGVGGQILAQDAEAFGVEAITRTQSGYELFVTDESGSVFKLSVADPNNTTKSFGYGASMGQSTGVETGTNNSNAVIQGISALNSADVAVLEASTGKNLDGKGNLPLSVGWTSSLKTNAIRTAVESVLQSSSKIDHAGVVKIVDAAMSALNAAGASTVGADTVSDLRALAARGGTLFTAKDLSGQESGYLDDVFNAMVNGSLANRFYTGGSSTSQTLGNLSAESSIDILQKLENKWLLGKDLSNPTTQGDTANPNATAATGSYKLQTGSLFIDGASIQDVQQGSAGDCYLMAALASMAQGKSNALKSVLVENGQNGDQNTWGVRLFDANGAIHWVTVNNQFVFAQADSSETSYAKARVSQGSAELWVPLLEKAYVQANELEILKRGNGQDGKNAFFAVEGGMADPFVTFLGGKATTFATTPEAGFSNAFTQTSVVNDVSSAMTEALNQGRLLWLGSSVASKNNAGSSLFVSGHAFALYDADPNSASNTSVKVFNPWGWSPEDSSRTQTHVTPFDADLVNIVANSNFNVIAF